MSHPRSASAAAWREVFPIFLRLGCTSFGGPVAHLGYFRAAFVERRGWLDERTIADLVALAQFLPGPASSRVGLAIGLGRAGPAGGLAAWLGFTLPSALLLTAFAFGVLAAGEALGGGWLAGLKIAAVAVVANAVRGMAANLCPDRSRATLAVFAAGFVTALSGPGGQVAAIALSGLAGLILLRDEEGNGGNGMELAAVIPRRLAVGCLAVFAGLLGALPLLAAATASPALDAVDAFYRAGALVFGGGHVVLPLLEAQVVGPGWIGREAFLAGYGMAQAIPGPLFTFSAYVGAAMHPLGGWLGAGLCLLAIFLPSGLLMLGTLPFWAALRRRDRVRAALRGVNAGVVGLLAAALYDPVWTSAIQAPSHFALALAAFLLLAAWRVSPALVVAGCALTGAALQAG